MGQVGLLEKVKSVLTSEGNERISHVGHVREEQREQPMQRS